MSQPLIAVTSHAVDRLRSRSATVRFADEVTIRLDVAQAIRHGRLASKPPRFLGSDCPASVRRRRKARDPGTVRFAWDPSEARCYVLRRQRCHDRGRHVWTVLTVLTRGDDRDTATRQPFAPRQPFTEGGGRGGKLMPRYSILSTKRIAEPIELAADVWVLRKGTLPSLQHVEPLS